MGVKTKEKGMYVNLTPRMDTKLAVVSKLMGRPKKEIVALALTKYIGKFMEFFEGITDLDEMIAKAKEIDLDAIEIDYPEEEVETEETATAEVETNEAEAEVVVEDGASDLPTADAGLEEF